MRSSRERQEEVHSWLIQSAGKILPRTLLQGIQDAILNTLDQSAGRHSDPAGQPAATIHLFVSADSNEEAHQSPSLATQEDRQVGGWGYFIIRRRIGLEGEAEGRQVSQVEVYLYTEMG